MRLKLACRFAIIYLKSHVKIKTSAGFIMKEVILEDILFIPDLINITSYSKFTNQNLIGNRTCRQFIVFKEGAEDTCNYVGISCTDADIWPKCLAHVDYRDF